MLSRWSKWGCDRFNFGLVADTGCRLQEEWDERVECSIHAFLSIGISSSTIVLQKVCLRMYGKPGDSERRVRDACALVRPLSLVPMYVLSISCSSRRPRKVFIRSFMWLFETISLIENESDDLPNGESDTEVFTVDVPNR